LNENVGYMRATKREQSLRAEKILSLKASG
jgi:hypothetical protein